MHSNYKHIGRGLAESAASILKGETLNEELSAAQKKLPPALQKAIAKKDGDKEEMMEPKKDKEKVEGMKMASKMKKAEKEPYHPGEGEHNQEELSPAQKKMDKNGNGKVDGEDLAKLRAKKEQLEEIIRDLESKIEE
jgi:hypothetical protein